MIAEHYLSIIEPLSEATRQELTALDLAAKDYLIIGLGDKDAFKHFHFKLRACVVQDSFFNESVHRNTYVTYDGTHVADDRFNPSSIAVQFFKRIPEFRWLGAKSPEKEFDYEVGATDYTVIVTVCSWPKSRIIFRSEDARLHFEYLLARFMSQTTRAKMAAEFKLKGVVPARPVDYRPHPEYPLSDYQEVAMQMGLGQELLALFMDPGTGKTATVIGGICLESARKMSGRFGKQGMMRILVVCPNQVRVNWRNEFEQFSTVPGKVTIIRGGFMKRSKLLIHALRTEDDCAFSVSIISYDSLISMAEILANVPWDKIVLDESHSIKRASTERFKALKIIRDSAVQRMILTGTPIANSVNDLWAQLEFLGEGMSGFTSPKAFKEFFGKYIKIAGASGNSVEKLVGLKNVPLLQERLSRVSFMITCDEAKLKLPDNVHSVYEVQMTPKQAEYYRKLATQLAIEIEATLSEDTRTITANHVLTKLLRLQQITSGYIKWDQIIDTDGTMVREAYIERLDENPKIQSIIDLIEAEEPNSKTVIWAIGTEEIEMISETLTSKGIIHGVYNGETNSNDREDYYDRFNNDETFKVFVGNPGAAGSGINLIGYNPTRDDQDTYCGLAIFYSQDWSMLKRSQAVGRTRRRGTKMPVKVVDLVCPGTIDEEIRIRVKRKQEVADLVTDIKDILKSLINFTYDEE